MVARVVRHDDLLAAAEDLAARVLRNDQWAVRSAKETIHGVIGRQLDDQLAYEALMGYSGAANATVPGSVPPGGAEATGATCHCGPSGCPAALYMRAHTPSVSSLP